MKTHLRMINAAVLQLGLAFFLGILIGTFSVRLTGPLQFSCEAGVKSGPAPILWLSLLALFCGSSIIGHYLIPALMLLRGYLLSASFAILLHCGAEVKTAALTVGLPALFSIPAFFLICEDSLSLSRIICLCNKSSLIRSCGYIQPGRLALSAILLVTAAALQIYYLPLIV